MESHDLTTGAVGPLLRRIAMPAAVGMFCNTLFNLTDTYFAAKLSTSAVAGLSIAFPVFFLIISVGAGLGAGTTALIANALGAKRLDEARLLAAQALVFCGAASALLAAAGFLAAAPVFRLLGAEGDYLAAALTYMRVVFAGSLFFVGSYAVNAGLVAAGETVTFRNVLAAGALLNVALDPWFMFGGLGLAPMGLAGAAVSTVLIQALGWAYMVHRAVRAGLLGAFTWRLLRPRAATLAAIFAQGAPAAVNHLTIGIGIFVITYYVSRFGDAAVAAYGVATRIEQVALLPTLGLTSATLAVAGQANGAGLAARMRAVWHAALRDGCVVMAAGGALIFVFADPATRLFTQDPAVVPVAVQYLRIAAFIAWAYVFLFVTTSMLQAVKRPLYAIGIGVYRQIAAPVLLYPLLSGWLGLAGLWLGVGAVTWSAGLFTLWWGHRALHGRGSAGPRDPGATVVR